MMMVGGVRQNKTAMQKWNETAMSGWMVVDAQQCQTAMSGWMVVDAQQGRGKELHGKEIILQMMTKQTGYGGMKQDGNMIQFVFHSSPEH